MKGRFWFSSAMAVLGASLLVAASLAGTAAGGPQAGDRSEARGGTWRIVLTSDFDHYDPALAYFTHSWNMNLALQLRLYYYPMVNGPRNQRIEPMAAASMPRVSRDGRTYTIPIKSGFKFSNGANVTAESFARAIARGKNAKLQSPASSFLDDVASFKVQRNNLIVRLTKVAPDFTARLTMPFFSAVPANTPLETNLDDGPYHSAGPYYLREWNKKSSALAVRNPHWRNNVAPFRSFGFPLNVDQIRWQVVPDPATQRLMCDRNEADICGFPPAQAKELADQHGINRANGRFRLERDLLVWRLDLNNEQTLFRNNPKLRQAVNFAIDRRFMIAQHGYLAGRRTDQFLPYGMPGFREFNIYPVKGPNTARAKQLAQGNLRSGKAVMYVFNRGAGPGVAQSVQFSLKQMGLDVEIKQFDRIVQNTKAATRGEPFDITVEGWHADYPDPANFINVLLDGRRLQAENNVNTSYFAGNGVRGYYQRLDQAYRTAGSQRLRLYGLLDRDLMKNGAPSAPYNSGNTRALLGPDAGCWTYSPQTGHVLVAVCKK